MMPKNRQKWFLMVPNFSRWKRDPKGVRNAGVRNFHENLAFGGPDLGGLPPVGYPAPSKVVRCGFFFEEAVVRDSVENPALEFGTQLRSPPEKASIEGNCVVN